MQIILNPLIDKKLMDRHESIMDGRTGTQTDRRAHFYFEKAGNNEKLHCNDGFMLELLFIARSVSVALNVVCRNLINVLVLKTI
jgi:hypothetical protein